MSSWARPAVGHMPFPGHRTCAEWDKPVNVNPAQYAAEATGNTQADYLTRWCNVPLALAQLVVMRADMSGAGIRKVRGPSRARSLVVIRRDIAIEAKRKGYDHQVIARALGRHPTTIINLLQGMSNHG